MADAARAAEIKRPTVAAPSVLKRSHHSVCFLSFHFFPPIAFKTVEKSLEAVADEAWRFKDERLTGEKLRITTLRRPLAASGRHVYGPSTQANVGAYR